MCAEMRTTSVSIRGAASDSVADAVLLSGNWFGGQAVSLAVNYTHADEFAKAGYAPMTVNGTEYGETREVGNFSFTRVYESGHEVNCDKISASKTV